VLETRRLSAGLDIVVPVYNEEGTVGELIDRVRSACPAAAVIVVDNASTDATVDVVRTRDGVRLVRHDRNLGYGASLRHGIEAGTGERVVMIDADLEYFPEDIPALDAALAGADAVYGSRFLGGTHGARSALWSLGNRTVTALFNVLFRQRLTDLYTGLRGIRRAALPAGALGATGFAAVLEIAALVARRGGRIVEVPIRYAPRAAGRSKMRHARELVRFVALLVRLRARATPR